MFPAVVFSQSELRYPMKCSVSIRSPLFIKANGAIVPGIRSTRGVGTAVTPRTSRWGLGCAASSIIQPYPAEVAKDRKATAEFERQLAKARAAQEKATAEFERHRQLAKARPRAAQKANTNAAMRFGHQFKLTCHSHWSLPAVQRGSEARSQRERRVSFIHAVFFFSFVSMCVPLGSGVWGLGLRALTTLSFAPGFHISFMCAGTNTVHRDDRGAPRPQSTDSSKCRPS